MKYIASPRAQKLLKIVAQGLVSPSGYRSQYLPVSGIIE